MRCELEREQCEANKVSELPKADPGHVHIVCHGAASGVYSEWGRKPWSILSKGLTRSDLFSIKCGCESWCVDNGPWTWEPEDELGGCHNNQNQR